MNFRYGCFLSYAHGHHGLMKRFIDNLTCALQCYLEPHFNNEMELFVDSEQLGGGDDLDGAIARALCESVCMIVIYTPKYEAHAYCRREYAAMQQIEAARRRLVELPGHLIIPVIMTRHPLGLPAQIAQPGVYVDFSRYTMATEDLASNPDFLPDIEKIVHRVASHYHCLRQCASAQHDCNQFVLPAVPPEWRANLPTTDHLKK